MSCRSPLLTILAIAAALCAGCGRSRDQYMAAGRQYFAAKKFNEAVIEFRNAVARDPQYAPAHAQLAEAYMRINDAGSAAEQFVAAADLLPDDIDAQLKAAGILVLGH